MLSLSYDVVDVFTDRPFAGNPLAVVFGAESLAGSQLQLIAREFNLSETVFVLPATVGEATYRTRVFTPTAELPFAGHPSVGAAVTAQRRGMIQVGEIIQECGAGLLPIRLSDSGAAMLTGGEPTVGEPMDAGPLLTAVGLRPDDQTGPPPRTAGCGLPFVYLPVREEALARVVVPPAAAVPKISVFSWDAAARLAHARVLCPGVGVPEDPATGSAALGLGVWLATVGLAPADGVTSYTVLQGIEMHRPSTMDCTVTSVGGRVTSATVSGHVVPIASGEIAIPPFVG